MNRAVNVELVRRLPMAEREAKLRRGELRQGQFSEAERFAKLREAFSCFDLDNSGTLTSQEMLALLTRTGSKNTELTLDDARTIVEGFDEDGNGVLSIDEFIRAYGGGSDDDDDDDDDDNDDMDEDEPVPDWGQIAVTRAQERPVPPSILPGNAMTVEEALAMGHSQEAIDEHKRTAGLRAQMLVGYIRAAQLNECLDILEMRNPAVDLSWQAPDIEATCLHFAIGTNQWRVAADLIELGAPVDALDGDGDTPLHAAAGLSIAGTDALDFAVDLLGGGALLRRNRDGLTPLDKAVRGASDNVAKTHPQLIELLKKAEEELGVAG